MCNILICELTCVYSINHQCINERISSDETLLVKHSETWLVLYLFQPDLLRANKMHSDAAMRISAAASPDREA
jgi:UV DNA damage repair endonuclease